MHGIINIKSFVLSELYGIWKVRVQELLPKLRYELHLPVLCHSDPINGAEISVVWTCSIMSKPDLLYISVPLQYISIIHWLFRSHEFGPVVFTDLSDILCLMAATKLYRTNFKFTVFCFEMEKLFGSFQNGCLCTNKLLHLILPNQNITSRTSINRHTAHPRDIPSPINFRKLNMFLLWTA